MPDNLFKNAYRIPSARLKNWDYSRDGYYYVTICTHNHKCLFGAIVNEKMMLNHIGNIVEEEWIKSQEMRSEIELDEFIVMPNHVHGIVIINHDAYYTNGGIEARVETHGRASLHNPRTSQHDDRVFLPNDCTIKKPRRAPKSLSSFIAGFKSAATKRINTYRHAVGYPVWQTRFFDHVIRNDRSLHTIRYYIHHNPLKWQEDPENPDVKTAK